MEWTIYYGIKPDGEAKIGVDEKYPSRPKRQNLTDYRILEIHTDIYIVSNREQELQREYNVAVDTIPYWKISEMNKSNKKRIQLVIANTGKKASEESKIKNRNSNLGKKASEETKRKMRESASKVPRTNEIKQKISNSRKGMIFTEEHKNKMSIAATERWKKKKQNLN